MPGRKAWYLSVMRTAGTITEGGKAGVLLFLDREPLAACATKGVYNHDGESIATQVPANPNTGTRRV